MKYLYLQHLGIDSPRQLINMLDAMGEYTISYEGGNGLTTIELPSEGDLAPLRTCLLRFEEEHDLALVGNSHAFDILREKDLLLAFRAMQEDMINEAFDKWCQENGLMVVFS